MTYQCGCPFKIFKRILVYYIILCGKMIHYFLYICKESQIKQKVLLELLTYPIGGNSGFLKAYHRVKKEFFWEGLKYGRFIIECLVYQQNKVDTVNTPCLLQPLDIPCQCQEEVSMKFITGVPKVEGKNFIMVVLDRITKYAHFRALSHPFSAIIVATTFMDIVKKLLGNPKIIVNDREHQKILDITIFLFGNPVGSHFILSSSTSWDNKDIEKKFGRLSLFLCI